MMSQRYLELLQHLEGEQLLSQVVSTFNNYRQQPPVREVTVRRTFSDPPAGAQILKYSLKQTLQSVINNQEHQHLLHPELHSPDLLLPGLLQGHR